MKNILLPLGFHISKRSENHSSRVNAFEIELCLISTRSGNLRTFAGICSELRILSLSGNITPTVELNALAMKRGEPAVYTFMEPSHHHGNHSAAPHNAYLPPPAPPGHNFNYRGMYNQVKPRNML
jgi:hypothetical protein